MTSPGIFPGIFSFSTTGRLFSWPDMAKPAVTPTATEGVDPVQFPVTCIIPNVMKNLFLPLMALFLACTSGQPSGEMGRWLQHATNTTIMRDDFGKTDADAVFGLLYAQCEDDFNRVEQNYIWAIGRLAEVEGPDALYSDLRARLFMSREEAIAAYENSPPWLRELCEAFADGVNYYLYTHPGVTPRLLTRFEPWMPMYFSEGSIGGDIERVQLEPCTKEEPHWCNPGRQPRRKRLPIRNPRVPTG